MKKPMAVEPLLALCAVVALVLTTVASLAQQSAQPKRPRQACAADYRKFCPDVKPGEGRIAQCMREHAGELSDPCKTSLQAAQARRSQQTPAQTPSK